MSRDTPLVLMINKLLDELRESVQLFETNDPEVAHLVSLIEDLRNIVSTLAYQVDTLKEKQGDK